MNTANVLGASFRVTQQCSCLWALKSSRNDIGESKAHPPLAASEYLEKANGEILWLPMTHREQNIPLRNNPLACNHPRTTSGHQRLMGTSIMPWNSAKYFSSFGWNVMENIFGVSLPQFIDPLDIASSFMRFIGPVIVYSFHGLTWYFEARHVWQLPDVQVTVLHLKSLQTKHVDLLYATVGCIKAF